VAGVQKSDQGNSWHLDGEALHHHEPEPVAIPVTPARDLSRERLERPVHVVTAEHLGWAAIAIYAALTRLVALGARPLDAREASHALYAFERATPGTHAAAGHYPAYGGWIHALTAGVFEFGGANDFSARIVFALSGLLLIAMGFVLRRHLGRAGGLALGAMIALSPSVTWFSRASATALPAAAMTLVTLAAFMELKARPGTPRAALLGVAAGLMIAADPVGLVSAGIFIAALAALGLWALVRRKNVGLAISVWLDRYAALPVLAIAAAGGTCALSQSLIPGGWDLARLNHGITMLSGDGARRAFGTAIDGGLRFYLPVLTLYEFMIVIAGALGAAAVLTFRIRSAFATWCLIWTAASIAFWLWTPVRNAESVLAMIIPIAVLGAIGLEWIHHSEIWRWLRVPTAAVAALTLYVGIVGNFIWATPDASEAPWARHANLWQGAHATTVQARLYTDDAAAGISPADATVFFDGEIAAPLRWYLRELRPVRAAESATVIVRNGTLAGGTAVANYHFDFAEGWQPDFGKARAADIMRFLLGGRIWGPVAFDDVTIMVRKPTASVSTITSAP
jgi:predicted membrane-bound mannosyltransferase